MLENVVGNTTFKSFLSMSVSAQLLREKLIKKKDTRESGGGLYFSNKKISLHETQSFHLFFFILLVILGNSEPHSIVTI